MNETEVVNYVCSPDPLSGPGDSQRGDRYRQLVENSRDVVVEVSKDGICQFVTPNAAAILGYPPAELLHTCIFDKVHPDDLAHVQEQFCLPEGLATCRCRHRDGTWRWVETTGRDFICPDGSVRGVLIVRDITLRRQADVERLQIEMRLRQIHKMEALGTLAGGIAHDFNNLLTVIIGCSELAVMDVDRPEEAAKHLAQVLKAGERAKELVHQILTFSSKQKQDRKPMHLQPVIKESLELMRHTLPASVQIEIQVDAMAPMILANPTQMHQIMINLCTNAAHAMLQRPGCLTVALKACPTEVIRAKAIPRLDCRPHVQLTISDTGHGMDARTLSRVFEPFFTTKKPGDGTGLGLSVVQGIVHEQHGAITVQSQPGVGTTLDIYLPVVDCAAFCNAAPVKPLPRGNGEHILLVDDEPAVCDSTQVLLRRLGYRVTTRTDADDALATFRNSPYAFDLLISDQTMPRMSGTELVQQVHGIRPALPALLMSGSNGISQDLARRAGVCDLLTKPSSLTVLANTVRTALRASNGGSRLT